VGVGLRGKMNECCSAPDLVLTVTQMLRKKEVRASSSGCIATA
jgi:aconitase A